MRYLIMPRLGTSCTLNIPRIPRSAGPYHRHLCAILLVISELVIPNLGWNIVAIELRLRHGMPLNFGQLAHILIMNDTLALAQLRQELHGAR